MGEVDRLLQSMTYCRLSPFTMFTLDRWFREGKTAEEAANLWRERART